MQEAKRRNISVGKRDLRAKSTIEKQNKLPKDGLERMLLQNDVPLAAMEEQLRAGIAWSNWSDADCVRALPSARTK